MHHRHHFDPTPDSHGCHSLGQLVGQVNQDPNIYCPTCRPMAGGLSTGARVRAMRCGRGKSQWTAHACAKGHVTPSTSTVTGDLGEGASPSPLLSNPGEGV
jgi:hypothetical protein